MDMPKMVTAERARLEPFIERVSGAEVRESFRNAFDDVAGRFALGRVDSIQFRARVRELTRNAAGTASQQDRDVSTSQAGQATGARVWATWPTDGSGALTTVERIVFVVAAVLMVAALVWVGSLAGKYMSGGSVSSTAPVATVSDAPSADTTGDHERELMIKGGYMAWQAFTECGNGPDACRDALRELNANPYGITVMEDGSLIESERDPNTVAVSLSALPSGDCWWEVRNDGTAEALCSGK